MRTRFGDSGKLTGHLSVDELELVQPLGAPRPEFCQIQFGLLPLGLVLVALSFQLLILEGVLLQGILGRLQLLIRLGFRQDGAFKFLGEQLLDLGALIDLLLELPNFGRMPLLPLHGLSFGSNKLIFQFQMLKDEQLEELALFVMSFLQEQPG